MSGRVGVSHYEETEPQSQEDSQYKVRVFSNLIVTGSTRCVDIGGVPCPVCSTSFVIPSYSSRRCRKICVCKPVII